MPANEMDTECIALCDAMNRLSDIRTVESCCGHGERPYHIWFRPKSLDALPPLLYWFDACHCGRKGWRVEVYTDCAMSDASFMVEGPIGAYADAEHIAGLIDKYEDECAEDATPSLDV